MTVLADFVVVNIGHPLRRTENGSLHCSNQAVG